MGSTIDTSPPENTAPEKSSFLKTVIKKLPWFLLYIALTCLLTRMVQDPAHRPIDPSFQQAYSYFFLNATQIGKDYIFTYGPLGHFMVPRFHPDLFWLDYVVTIILGLVIAWPVYAMIRVLKGRYWAQLSILIPIVLTAEVNAGSDIPALMSSLLLVILIRDGQVSSRWLLGLTGIFWAFLALCKFTLMTVNVGFVGYLCIHFLLQRDWKKAFILPTTFLVSMVIFWIMARQELGNFATFMLDSIEVSKAYILGMRKDDDPSMYILVYLTIAAVYVCTGVALKSSEASRIRVFIDVFFVSVMIFILWRLGLTRNNSHEAKFFLPMMILPFFSCGSALLVKRTKTWSVAAGLVLIIGVWGYGISASWTPVDMAKNAVNRSYKTAMHILTPRNHRFNFQHRWLTVKKVFDLPVIREKVGHDSIDILSYEQRLLMFHEYNFTPRYVYQGYQACTPKLLEKNGESYWGTDSITPPEYIVYQQLQLDKRFPTMEDSQAILAMMYCYEAVLHEEGFLLYRRISDPPKTLPAPTSEVSGTLTLDERYTLPEAGDDWQLLSLDFNPSVTARMKQLPWRKPNFGIQVFYDDGTNAIFKLLPSMTTLPFLIPPDATTPPDLIDDMNRPLEMPKAGDKVIEAIEVIDQNGHTVASEWEIHYTVSNVPAPTHKTGWSL